MPDTYSGNYNFVMPEPGASIDTWGTKLNSNWRSLDQILGAIDDRLAYAEQGAPRGQLSFQCLSDRSLEELKAATAPADMIVKPGWVVAKGQAISTGETWEDFQGLRQALLDDGSPYGKDANSDPLLPNPRGLVIRAADLGAGVDPDGDRALGAVQQDVFKAHNHAVTVANGGGHNHSGTTSGAGGHSHTGSTSSAGAHSHSYYTTRARDAGGGGRDGRLGGGQNLDTQGPDSRDILSAGNHTHSVDISSVSNHSHAFTTSTAGVHTHTASAESTGNEDETRMKNICFVLSVRY